MRSTLLGIPGPLREERTTKTNIPPKREEKIYLRYSFTSQILVRFLIFLGFFSSSKMKQIVFQRDPRDGLFLEGSGEGTGQEG
jgi:hypothetical protein